MQSKATFTGRSRPRTTRSWVRFGDGLARAVITLGGIGTIAAVLLMGVFLLAVALPLFRSARILSQQTTPLSTSTARRVAALGSDETGSVGWVLDSTEEGDGLLTAFHTATGEKLTSRPLAGGGLAEATCLRIVPGQLLAAVGYADGAFRPARIGLESEFVDDAALPAGLELKPGEAREIDGTVLLHDESGRYAKLRLIAETTAEPSRELSARVIDIDITQLAAGPLLAALDATGGVRVETVSSRRNLMTDAVVTTCSGATLAPVEPEAEGASPALFIRLSELGDQLFVFTASGMARRYAIRSIESPQLMESFDAAPGDAGIAMVTRLYGGNALAVADTSGAVRIFYATRVPQTRAPDGLKMMVAKAFAPARQPAAITAMAASPRSRLFVVGDATGTVRVLQSTHQSTLLTVSAVGSGLLKGPPVALAVSPREKVLLAADGRGVAGWGFDAAYPEVSAASLFGKVWYETYPAEVHAWETTGHESFEPKFGFMPLVFGTIKATFYSMAFATPIAILAAIYSSQFLQPQWKSRLKPTIEMMASLPSVVLGFVAGLIFAPVVEHWLMVVVTGFFVIPLTLLLGAHLWLLMPAGWRVGMGRWRFLLVGAVVLPLGGLAALAVAPLLERWLFAGDLRGWLEGRDGSGLGGWVLALFPLASVVAMLFCGRVINPWLRRESVGWSPRRAAIVSLATFLAGVAVALVIALAAATFLDALRIDARGGVFGTYVQRNAMIVAFGMSFAIIPLIFTIADDALSSVPEHLRSASLGAGATPWQTAVRVIMPAAASGLFSAVMIGLGRAVGETMIVLMAAGNTPLMDWSLFNGFQTLSAALATELPEAARGSAHYRVLFLAALTLFAMTFVLNTVAEIIRERFRRSSHEL